MTAPHAATCTCPACLDRIEAVALVGDVRQVVALVRALREANALAETRREALSKALPYIGHVYPCGAFSQLGHTGPCSCGGDAARAKAEAAVKDGYCETCGGEVITAPERFHAERDCIAQLRANRETAIRERDLCMYETTAMRAELDRLRAECGAIVELVSRAAPLAWCAHDDAASAEAWEKDAHAALSGAATSAYAARVKALEHLAAAVERYRHAHAIDCDWRGCGCALQGDESDAVIAALDATVAT